MESAVPNTRWTNDTGNCDAKHVMNHGVANKKASMPWVSRWADSSGATSCKMRMS